MESRFLCSDMASTTGHSLPSTLFARCDDNGEHEVRASGGVRILHLPQTSCGRCISRIPVCSHSRTRGLTVEGRRSSKVGADLLSVAENANSRSTFEIPVTCFQLIGVSGYAEKDEIVKTVMQLKGVDIEEGYTMDAVVSRKELLMDLRDKLLFEPEYAGNIKENIPPKASLQIPWAWLPGALCLLHEAGEVKLVLDIGCQALQHPEAKTHIHDLLLSMALAECAIAKIYLEKNNVSKGFEALARSQCLLRSNSSLSEMSLLLQIEESLEGLAPACALELLGLPQMVENAEQRRRAIAALQEMLRQGLDVDILRQDLDWSCFFHQALNKLSAAEIVDLLPWDSLTVTRKKKKSLESQNQRAVIDFDCFYTVLIAHIALGFASGRKDLISKGKAMCECLTASDGVDLNFEGAFCSLLLGQAEEAEAIEKLRHRELNSTSAAPNSISAMEKKNEAGKSPSLPLEIWLRDAVLSVFPDTRDCSPCLANFFGDKRKTSGKKEHIVASRTVPILNPGLSEGNDIQEPVCHVNPFRHFGPVVKQLAPADSQNPLASRKNTNGTHNNSSSLLLDRNLSLIQGKVWESCLASGNLTGRITFAVALGCIFFATFKLTSMRGAWPGRGACKWNSRTNMVSRITNWSPSSYVDHPARSGMFKKLRSMIKLPCRNYPEAVNLPSSCLASSISSSVAASDQRLMPIEEAENLVRQWQAIKAEAVGPSYCVYSLSEILDGSMLDEWQALANTAKERSCFWRFVLLELSVVRADILIDKAGAEKAEIEAHLKEAAELVGESEDKNPNYYSTYKIHYNLRRRDDGTWRFCGSEIQA